MARSSPEGIELDKGSKLVSLDLSINKEKVLSIKQEKKYNDEDMIAFGEFIFKHYLLTNIKGVKSLLEQFKNK
jgi:hypothetical protein